MEQKTITKTPKPILHSEEEFDFLHPVETIQKFVADIRECLSRYDSDKTRLIELESEMQDLLHFMEMAKDKDIQKGYKLYRRLAEVRRERRQVKNEIDLLWPVYEMFHETKLLGQLQNTQGSCRKAKETIENRGYSVRTDILEEFIDR